MRAPVRRRAVVFFFAAVFRAAVRAFGRALLLVALLGIAGCQSLQQPRLVQGLPDDPAIRAATLVLAGPLLVSAGDLRFETEGAWKRSGTTVDSLAKELRLALQYPEGAAV